jgi:tripartite-type tricarboxylate transporter receptor subunit TctC
MISTRLIGMAAALTAVIGFAAPASATYPEKDINFVIPFSPGGGFDVYVRLIAPFVEKHLPNKVNVVPRNEPGAGGRKGLTHVYRSKPDGYNIVIVNVPGAMIEPIIGHKVQYDLEKITWICRLSTDAYLLAVPSKSPMKTFNDFRSYAKTHPIKLPSTGAGSTADAMSKVFLGVLGIKGEVIGGYKGTKEMTIGVIRGDTPAGILPAESTRQYIKAGELRGLISTDDPSSVAGVPSAKSLGMDDIDGLLIHRLVAAPPGLPHAIKQTLEKAFMDAMADPALVAAAKKANRPMAPLNAEQAGASVKKQLQLYLRFKKELAAQ